MGLAEEVYFGGGFFEAVLFEEGELVGGGIVVEGEVIT